MFESFVTAFARLVEEILTAEPQPHPVFTKARPLPETPRRRDMRLMSEARDLDQRLRAEHPKQYVAWVDSQAWRLLNLELREADRVRRAHERAVAKAKLPPRSREVRSKPTTGIRSRPEFQRLLCAPREDRLELAANPEFQLALAEARQRREARLERQRQP
jgi:hypothetical protein